MKPTEYTSTTDPTHRNVCVITSLNVHESRQRRRGGGRSEADRRRLLLHQRQTIRKPIIFIIYALLATSVMRCTASDATPFMSRPLWRRGDKLARKLSEKCLYAQRAQLVMFYYSNSCWQSKAHHSLTALTCASVPTHTHTHCDCVKPSSERRRLPSRCVWKCCSTPRP